MTDADQTRRRFLAITGSAAIAALAGCTGDGGSGSDGGGTTTESMDDGSMDDEPMEGEESMDDGDSMEEDSMDDGDSIEEDSMDDGDSMDEESMDDGDSMEEESMDEDDSMEDDSTDDDSMEEDEESGTSMGGRQLTLEVEDLPELQQGTYEGWAIYGDEKVSTGTFSVGDDLTFTVEGRDLRQADTVAVTIEPEDDPSPAPSGVVVLAGEVRNREAALSFPVDFGDASGSYILATPTNGGDSDETSGIWFLDPSGGPSASLDLPDLPDGWVYEGWIATDNRAFTTGRFGAPDRPDDFDGYSGPRAAPPFPGEDFLEDPPGRVLFPLRLANGYKTAVVTVEPDIDGTDPTGEGPFPIKPLVGEIPEGADPMTSYDMQAQPDATPRGTATIQ